jgi:hypothetical protein
MNYERLKKAIVSLALVCAFVFSTMVATAVPANAQGQYYIYYPQRVVQPYCYPWVGYRYPIVYPYGYYPTRYYIRWF